MKSGPKIVRWVLGLLLVAAALLKGHELSTGPLTGAGVLGNRWVMAGAVEAEALLGLWLLSGWRPAAAGGAACACFFAYAFFALWKALTGADSCGCFGRVPVNPWITLGIDLAALPGAVWVMRNAKRGMRNEEHVTIPHSAFRIPHLRFGFGLILLIAGVGGFLKMTVYHAAGRDDVQLRVLNAREWIGKSWPIGEHVEGWTELKRGRWAVLLYSWPCGHCGPTVAEWSELALEWQARGARERVALIDTGGEVMPEELEALLNAGPALRGRLNGPPEWFIPSPTLVVLSEGRVVAVADGEDECRWDAGRLGKWEGE